MINVTSCVQSVLHLQPQSLEVSFATLQLLYQGGAPAHRARETVELLKVETPDFIPPNLWPSNSPNLNPVDYKIWAYCKNGFTSQAVRMSTSYDAGLLRNGTSLTSAFDKAVGEWRKRLQACVAAGGGHFEHKIFCIGILRPNSLKYCCFVQ